jgi:hypothetical protein
MLRQGKSWHGASCLVARPATDSSVISGEPTLVDIPAGKPCVVRWADLPDPTNRQVDPAITQRRVLEIADPRAEKVLVDNKFKLVCTVTLSAFTCLTVDELGSSRT